MPPIGAKKLATLGDLPSLPGMKKTLDQPQATSVDKPSLRVDSPALDGDDDEELTSTTRRFKTKDDARVRSTIATHTLTLFLYLSSLRVL
jgi:hypothetical protein